MKMIGSQLNSILKITLRGKCDFLTFYEFVDSVLIGGRRLLGVIGPLILVHVVLILFAFFFVIFVTECVHSHGLCCQGGLKENSRVGSIRMQAGSIPNRKCSVSIPLISYCFTYKVALQTYTNSEKTNGKNENSLGLN